MSLFDDKPRKRDITVSTVSPSSEFSLAFIGGMLARMAMSFFKYGRVKEAYPDRVNAIDSLKLRLDKYAETGNTEYLMDAANFCMIEFMFPAHPGAFFEATDSDGSPGRVGHVGGRSARANDELRSRTTDSQLHKR